MKKLVLLCIMICSLALIGCSKPKEIDLSATTFNVEGLNGNGFITADYTAVDDQGLEDEATKLMNDGLAAAFSGKDYSKLDEQYSKLKAFAESLDCTWDKENGTYSNGDVATYTCKFNEEASKSVGYTFTNTTITYTVEGLQEVEEVDLFEGIDYEWDFDSYSSWNGVRLKLVSNPTNAWVRDNVNYSAGTMDASGNFTVTASYNETAFEAAGYVAKDGETSKTYNIGAKPVAITEVITDDTREAATTASENYLNSLFDQCGNVFMYKGNPVNIYDYSFVEFRSGVFTGFGANYTLKDENGNPYNVFFNLSLFRLGDGTIKDMTPMKGSCEVKYQSTNSYDVTYW